MSKTGNAFENYLTTMSKNPPKKVQNKPQNPKKYTKKTLRKYISSGNTQKVKQDS
jgi:hypothetical protein